jgi:hypothetical protein
MSGDTFLSWDEVHRMALPANATILIPPTPDPAELVALSSGAPEQKPDWLDDAFQSGANGSQAVTIDPDANRAAAERSEYGDPAVRMLANMIAVNAVLEYALTPAIKAEKDEKPIPAKSRPEQK